MPGRLDPVTLGHECLARRAATLCDQLIVAVAERTPDRPFRLPLEQRMALATEALGGIANAKVVPLSGLLVDCAREHGARAIVKGVRTVEDLGRERHMADVNRLIGQGLETLLLPALPERAHISSTIVRELAGFADADLSEFVRPAVASALRRQP